MASKRLQKCIDETIKSLAVNNFSQHFRFLLTKYKDFLVTAGNIIYHFGMKKVISAESAELYDFIRKLDLPKSSSIVGFTFKTIEYSVSWKNRVVF